MSSTKGGASDGAKEEPPVKKREQYLQQLKEEFHIDKHLIPIKIVIFLFNGGMLAFLPFLTLHMQQLGITVKEIAVMYALLPCCALIGPPVMGLLADRLGRYVLVLNITIFCGGLFHTLLLLVPPAPPGPALMRCTPSGYEIVRENCDPCLLQSNMTEVHLALKDCYYDCDGVRRPLSGLDGVLCFQNQNVSHCIQLPYTDTLNISGIMFLHHPNRYHCSFVLQSKSVVLGNIPRKYLGYDFYENIACPLNTESKEFRESMTTNEYLELDTVPEGELSDGRILDELQQVEDEDRASTITLRTTSTSTMRTTSTTTASSTGLTSPTVFSTEEVQDSFPVTTNNYDVFSAKSKTILTTTPPTGLTSPTVSSTEKVHDSFPMAANNYEVFSDESVSSYVKNKCRLRCRVRGAPSCATKEGGSRFRTLIIYFVFRGLGSFSIASSYTMMDATTLTLMRQYKGDYGKQRAVNMVAFAIIPAFAGLLMDYQSTANKMDFTPLFIVSDVLFLLSIIGISNMKIKVVIPSNKLLDNVKELLSRGEINVFLVLICILGLNFGFIESYLFVYLKSMKATGFLLGLTISVGASVSFPILIWADKIVLKLGRHVIFITSFLVYTVRMIGYSLITNPWMCLPFEALEIFTYQLMWVATATYCSVMAPPGLLATTTGLIGCMHYSIGRGLGAFLGGYIISKLTMRRAFRMFGMIALGGAVLYSVVHYYYLRHKIREREEETRRTEALKSGPVTDRLSMVLLNNVAAMTSSRHSLAMVSTAPPIRRMLESRQDGSHSSDDFDRHRKLADYAAHFSVQFSCQSLHSTSSMPTALTHARSLFSENHMSSPNMYDSRAERPPSEPRFFTSSSSGRIGQSSDEALDSVNQPLFLKADTDETVKSTCEQVPPSPEKLSDQAKSEEEEVTVPLNKPAKEGASDLSTIR